MFVYWIGVASPFPVDEFRDPTRIALRYPQKSHREKLTCDPDITCTPLIIRITSAKLSMAKFKRCA